MNIPKQCNKEITFMLYNYNNIDKIIEDRKEEIMDNMSVTNTAYLKSIKSKNGNTLEDIVMKIDSDKYIKRLKKWKQLINSFCSKLYDNEDKSYYWFIQYKYIFKRNNCFIREHMNLDNKKLNKINTYLKWLLYEYAVIEELFVRKEAN